jgi:septal ring factor EnvC (AmiA/AmiB activator)
LNLKFVYCFIVLFTICFVSIICQNYKKSELENTRKKTIEEIEFTSTLIEENSKRSNESLQGLNLLNHKVLVRKRLIATIGSEIEQLDALILINNSSIISIEEKQRIIILNYAKSIYLTYKNKRNNNLVLFILASENINQAYKRYRYIQIINENRKRQVVLLNELKEELKKENDKLMEIQEKKYTLNLENTRETELLNKEIKSQSEAIKRLKKKDKELKKELAEKEKIADKLKREIESLIEIEQRKIVKGSLYESLTPEERLISNEFGKNYGKLPWPTKQGIVVGKFGEQEHPTMKGIKVRNDGIYIATISNAEVRSIFKGVVTKVFSIPGSNYTVIIKHGNYYSLYHNLKDVRVKIGNMVNTKEIIGSVSTDLEKNETILHFQLWKDTERNDPELWLSK